MSKKQPSNNKALSRCIIVLLKGNGLSSSISFNQIDIWKRGVDELGGQLLVPGTPALSEQLWQHGSPDVVFVVDSDYAPPHLLRATGLECLPRAINSVPGLDGYPRTHFSAALRAEYHSPEWLMNCLRYKRRETVAACPWVVPVRSGSAASAPSTDIASEQLPLSSTFAPAAALDADGPGSRGRKRPRPDSPLNAEDASSAAAAAAATSDAPSSPFWGVAAHPYEIPPSTAPLFMSREDIAALHACGDDASRFGTTPGARPVPCPFSHEQIMRANRSILHLFPWLELLIPPDAPSSAAPSAAALVHTGATSLAASTSAAIAATAGENLNEHITKHLQPLLAIYEANEGLQSHRWKQMQAAIGIIARLPRRINTVDELPAPAPGTIDNIGPKTREKIIEILRTGTLKRTDKMAADPDIQCKIDLMTIPWVGGKKADELMKLGARSVADVRDSPALLALLPAASRACLPYLEELQQRIPRAEGERTQRYIAQQLEEICAGSLCVLGGSFRRGAPDSSDFDVIICPPQGLKLGGVLEKLVHQLQKKGFLTQDKLPGAIEGFSNKAKTRQKGGALYHARGGKAASEADSAGESSGDDGIDAAFERRGHGSSSSKSGTVGHPSPARESASSSSNSGMHWSSSSSSSSSSSVGANAGTSPAGFSPSDFQESMTSTTACSAFAICLSPPDPLPDEARRHRRIDLLLFDTTEIATGLSAWTGNTPLNRSLARYANNLGFTLDARHLTINGEENTAASDIGLTGGMVVRLRSEFDLYSFLGLRFIPPQRRGAIESAKSAGGSGSCSDNTSSTSAAAGGGSGSGYESGDSR